MGFLECLLGEDREYEWRMSSEGVAEQNEPLPVCAGPSQWPLFAWFSRVVEADGDGVITRASEPGRQVGLGAEDNLASNPVGGPGVVHSKGQAGDGQAGAVTLPGWLPHLTDSLVLKRTTKEMPWWEQSFL